MCEKNGTFTKSSQQPHGCVSLASKYRLSQAHFAACHALVSSYKSEKHPWKWSGIVSLYFTLELDEENCREPVKQQQKGNTATRRKLTLSCTFMGNILSSVYIQTGPLHT